MDLDHAIRILTDLRPGPDSPITVVLNELARLRENPEEG